MVVPLLIPALVISGMAVGSAADIYTTHQSTKASDIAANYANSFYSSAMAENSRFWSDYINKHHLQGREIKYPYRTGFNYDATKLYSADSRLVANQMNRYSSYAGGIRNVFSAAGVGYGAYFNLPYPGAGKSDPGFMYG